jgi:hypothetical protein
LLLKNRIKFYEKTKKPISSPLTVATKPYYAVKTYGKTNFFQKKVDYLQEALSRCNLLKRLHLDRVLIFKI